MSPDANDLRMQVLRNHCFCGDLIYFQRLDARKLNKLPHVSSAPFLIFVRFVSQVKLLRITRL